MGLTDKALLDLAVDRFGTKRRLATFLHVSPQAVGNYYARGLPRHVRRILELEISDRRPTEVTPPLGQGRGSLRFQEVDRLLRETGISAEPVDTQDSSVVTAKASTAERVTERPLDPALGPFETDDGCFRVTVWRESRDDGLLLVEDTTGQAEGARIAVVSELPAPKILAEGYISAGSVALPFGHATADFSRLTVRRRESPSRNSTPGPGGAP